MTVRRPARAGRGARGLHRVAGAALLCACVLTAASGCRQDHAPPRHQGGQERAAPSAAAVWQPPAAGERGTGPVAEPVRVRVPAVGVDAAVRPLEVAEGRILQPPASYESTGWWRDGPEPGEPGPAVIVGHLDSARGPAVFHRLGELEAGDPIMVDRADGTTVVFAVHRVERHSKDEFPTGAVYGDTPDPRLRLITCDGMYDHRTGGYRDNLVVYAVHEQHAAAGEPSPSG